ncbi:hypothetical protein [Paenibacillus sp. IHBB 10380]|uniref:hypothetical protein n=1 Tax=Paenibacillus sp. IHBB 10380 TaxID=1566358 RepID=UPI001F383AE5|nr:hypothetical protein [Paenibacillus sp. IHBB 10380]
MSKKYEIKYYETDNFVWDRTLENTRYPVEVRDAKLNEIVTTEAWIIEGIHHKWGIESFKQADLMFLIKSNKYVRDFRIIKRFVRTRVGLEQWNYKQSFKNLYEMLFIWNKGFDKDSIQEIMELTEEYSEKRIIVKDNKEIMKYIQDYLNANSGRQ